MLTNIDIISNFKKNIQKQLSTHFIKKHRIYLTYFTGDKMVFFQFKRNVILSKLKYKYEWKVNNIANIIIIHINEIKLSTHKKEQTHKTKWILHNTKGTTHKYQKNIKR